MIVRRAASSSNSYGNRLLEKSSPAGGATLATAPAVIDLWFSEVPEAKVTTVQLARANAKPRKLQKVTADEEDAKHLIATVDSTLAPGAWTVSWRTMSRDGHVVNGEIAFTLEAVR